MERRKRLSWLQDQGPEGSRNRGILAPVRRREFRSQRLPKTPTEFPQIPQEITSTSLQDYLARLPKGAIYTRNRWGESPVYDAAISEDGSHLAVLTEISGVTHYALSEVTFENGFFVHKSIRTFFTEEGAQKYFTESRGLEWTGGDVMEDYC